jgi:hypothetical protein
MMGGTQGRRFTLREKLGAVVLDVPRFLWGMRPGRAASSRAAPWVFIRNRHEHLVTDAARSGVRCDWRWTSDLYVAKVFPLLGLWLMRRALSDYPIRLCDDAPAGSADPEVTFIIGHRGLARFPVLQMTLRSIAGQRDVRLECIVVEQSQEPQVAERLPRWVRYAHTPPPRPDSPYSRSWALNVGAGLARGRVLVLHDNDMLVPEVYAREMVRRCDAGYEVVNLKRFVFYLQADHSVRILGARQVILDEAPEAIVQNLEAGGSVAVTRDAYSALGGFDETFVGWGGEDNEFWDRCGTRRVSPHANLPVVHLWHAPQAEKHRENRDTARLLDERLRQPAADRVAALQRARRAAGHAGGCCETGNG